LFHGSEDNAKAKFLQDDGFWKGTDEFNQKLNAGDEIEVTVAKMVCMTFAIRHELANSIDNCKITIKKSSGQEENKFLLPIRVPEIVVNADNPAVKIYAVEDTKINIQFTPSSGLKLKSWNKGNPPSYTQLHGSPWYTATTPNESISNYQIKNTTNNQTITAIVKND